MVELLSKIMLQDQRQYVIDKIKKPIMKALIVLANRLPEPTIENTQHPNTHAWIRVIDRFLEMEDNPREEQIYRAIKRLFVDEHEHDIYQRDRINVIMELWLEEVFKGNWKPRSLDHPNLGWKVDPNIRGEGFKFLQDRYYHGEEYNALQN